MTITTSLEVVVVGDSGVGKTFLLISYTTNRDLPPDYLDSVPSEYVEHHTVDDVAVALNLFDTAGQSDFDRLRPFTYPQTDVFFICFSIVNSDSYEHVRTKWYPELVHHESGNAEIILVGTKLDLRNDPQALEKLANRRISPIIYSQGVAMARDIGATKYCECSAYTRKGVDNVSKEAMRAAINSPHPPSKGKKESCIVA